MWDSVRLPEVWHRLTNRGSASAHNVRWQMLTASPDRYGPMLGIAVALAPGDAKLYPEWQADDALHRDDISAALQVRYLYHDGTGEHRLTVRLWVGQEANSLGAIAVRVKVVWATIDGQPHPTMRADPAVAQYAVD